MDQAGQKEAVDPEQFQLFRRLPPEKSKLSFDNQLVENNRINILNYLYYYNGSGVAVGDINNDGLPDIYFASTVGKNKLFLNKGNLVFEDITQSAGVEGDFGITTGVNFIDINNDGFLDLYICKSGDQSQRYRTNQLFINQGNLSFVEQAAAFGLDDTSFSNQAYFFDMDQDNDLDLYLVNHPIDWPNINKIMTGEQEKEGFHYEFSDKLYRNNGQGKFEDITRTAGVLNRSWGLSAAIGDFNGDQRPDIYVANDFIKPDYLYINNGDGTFSDRLPDYFRHISFYSMGSDYADINNDGLNDLYVADMAMKGHVRSKRNMGSMSTENFQTIVRRGYHYPYAANNLHLNLGNNSYTEIAQTAGVQKTDWSWAPLLLDLDNDGLKDLFITNGIFRDIIDNDFLAQKSRYDQTKERNYFDDLIKEIPQSKVKNFVFRNKGDLSFKDMSQAWGITETSCSNGAAYADLDQDGDLDMIINNLNEPSVIYENLSNESLAHHFIKVQLTGPANNINGIGAKVEIRYGQQIQRLDLNPARGYLSTMDYSLHFGLGTIQAIDEIEISWPDGKKTIQKNPKINRTIHLKYTAAQTPKIAQTPQKTPLLQNITSAAQLQHKQEEMPYDDFKKELLLPHKLSQNGPFLSVADVNQDQLEDFFIGGAAGRAASLYLQNSTGGFNPTSQDTWLSDKQYEDQASLFFDADQDGDLDLYVVSGSNEFDTQLRYQDRLYLNDGTGKFEKASRALPTITASGMAVDAGDFDQDGDLDLIVGGRVVPGKYPSAPQSYLLENKGGIFTDITAEVAPDLQHLGMITDLEFSDYDQDQDLDVVLVGEWMPITILENSNASFQRIATATNLAAAKGWWFSITSGDIDQDGDLDYVLGNIGTNNKYQANPEHPLHIYYADFDQNGTGDIVLSKREEETHYPLRGRECSSQQMPFISDKYTDFASFASATMEDIYSEELLSTALHYEATEFKSCVLLNEGAAGFRIQYLPTMAQISPLMNTHLLDINQDGHLDILGAGNFFETETETIRYDGGSGIILLGDGKGGFTALPNRESGLQLNKDVKDIKLIQLAGGNTGILVANNNDYLELWQKSSQ